MFLSNPLRFRSLRPKVSMLSLFSVFICVVQVIDRERENLLLYLEKLPLEIKRFISLI